ncbi:hypothetical protein [Microvirga sp. Mcv34]|uniref:hypothetical protein n=1 Tax=Microvirga sp. Mcv34 TaxID=2926016 RepID=UPI0021C84B6F|nr:hypothetical protein [Microvirga sp. Mcv34]
MTKLHKTPEEWAKVNSADVALGSQAQARNVLEMALQDIQTLAGSIEYLERIKALRDGYKGGNDERAEGRKAGYKVCGDLAETGLRALAQREAGR